MFSFPSHTEAWYWMRHFCLREDKIWAQRCIQNLQSSTLLQWFDYLDLITVELQEETTDQLFHTSIFAISVYSHHCQFNSTLLLLHLTQLETAVQGNYSENYSEENCWKTEAVCPQRCEIQYVKTNNFYITKCRKKKKPLHIIKPISASFKSWINN